MSRDSLLRAVKALLELYALALMRRAAQIARSVLNTVHSRSMRTMSALEEVRAKSTDLEKYLYLKQLQRHAACPTLDCSEAAATP